MGTTQQLGLIYGINFTMNDALEKAAEEAVDIEFLITDNYSLLGYETAGNYRSEEIHSLIYVKEIGFSDFHLYLADVPDSVFLPVPAEAIAQLQHFCRKFNVDYNPCWKVFNSLG